MDKTGKTSKSDLVVDDRLVRVIGIPFFGIVIPAATGLVDFSPFTWVTALHLGYFVLLAFLIWQGNRWLLFRYYPIVFESNSTLYKYLLMIGLNIFYSAPVSIICLLIWNQISDNPVGWDIIGVTVAVIVICVIFVTNVYEKALFTRHNENEKVRVEQLERARVEAELEALKNQIDPHFMFNSLNSLSYLIEHDKIKAQGFVNNLADVYRYILRNKDRNLVMLRDEISFLDAYASLMKLRFENGFQLRKNGSFSEDFLIPPVSLMIALENAVKHNEVSDENPLIVELTRENNVITIRNPIIPRKSIRESTKMGLKNLQERFEKTIGNPVIISHSENWFVLKIPLLELNKR